MGEGDAPFLIKCYRAGVDQICSQMGPVGHGVGAKVKAAALIRGHTGQHAADLIRGGRGPGRQPLFERKQVNAVAIGSFYL